MRCLYVFRLISDGRNFKFEKMWTCELDSVIGGVILGDDMLYGSRYLKPQLWFVIDRKTGGTRFQLDELTTGVAIYADQRLYCLDEIGEVALLRPAEYSLEIVSRFQLVPKKVNDAWAHPVLLDARLYLRYHDTLYCNDVKK
ncbi:MAG: hypothetical protein JXA82_03480 [Sedimentisphaerales bacterium]|nr:hypothetical protein [Sedimentisphaerales bacterium]